MPETPPPTAPLTLFDSLTRSLRDFAPIDPPRVRVYSCGPTVYNYQHIGNMRAYVFADTLGRVLRWKGYELTHIINITDVGHLTSDADAGDDKMEAAARAAGKSAWEIAAFYTAAFKRDIERLNINPPARWSLATEHIAEMIEFAERIAPEHCYEIDSGLYFDATTIPEYGRLAGAAGGPLESRIEDVAGKRHPQDFAIWRRSDPDEKRQMEWDSPWGSGAPGWHLECSVMSFKYLGEQFDIHTGGIDHREIHHPNEIAQNQAYTDSSETGANIWMHNNFLIDREGKMSKSKGEFLTLQALVDRGVHPLAYRLMCLQAHYRSELEFTWANLAAALTRLKRLVMTLEQVRDAALLRTVQHRAAAESAPVWSERGLVGGWVGYPLKSGSEANEEVMTAIEAFDASISDDLNTAKALTVLDDVMAASDAAPEQRLAAVGAIDRVLGLDLLALSRADLRVRPVDATIDEDQIERRLGLRESARADKNFPAADAIRDELTAAGVEIMDGDALRWDWRLDL